MVNLRLLDVLFINILYMYVQFFSVKVDFIIIIIIKLEKCSKQLKIIVYCSSLLYGICSYIILHVWVGSMQLLGVVNEFGHQFLSSNNPLLYMLLRS